MRAAILAVFTLASIALLLCEDVFKCWQLSRIVKIRAASLH